jgi:hypothetical protein
MLFTRGKRQLGYALITDPANGMPEEQDSLTCGHCGSVKWMKPFQSGEAMGGHCTCCDKFICLACVGKGCTPMQKRLELMERLKDYEWA